VDCSSEDVKESHGKSHRVSPVNRQRSWIAADKELWQECGITPDERVITAYYRHLFTMMCEWTMKGVLGELLG
jgi:hypothetical protein